MRVLLDTSYLFDLMGASGRFRDAERRFFERHAARLYVSAVSIWEMRLKYHARHGSGDRKSRFDPEDVVAALEQHNVTFLPMTPAHAARKLEVPIPHRDPFDELLLVQAQEDGLKLLTHAHPPAFRSPDIPFDIPMMHCYASLGCQTESRRGRRYSAAPST